MCRPSLYTLISHCTKVFLSISFSPAVVMKPVFLYIFIVYFVSIYYINRKTVKTLTFLCTQPPKD